MPKLPYDTHPSDTRQQAYARGYNRGHSGAASAYEARIKAAEDATADALARAQRVEAGAGIGHCQNCAAWTRGTGSAVWGYCGARYNLHVRDEPWVYAEDGGAITTRENFGCILFKPLGEQVSPEPKE